MTPQRIEYDEARTRMLPGDVVAFSGVGFTSWIIKAVTGSRISHVGVIRQTRLFFNDEVQPGFFNEIVEATTLKDVAGVTTSRFSDRLREYEGSVWWLPLSEEIRGKLDLKRFFDFLFHQVGKRYDTRQAVMSAIDFIPWVKNSEDKKRLFCSELIAMAIEYAGALTRVNASEVTPADLVRMGIYGGCYQLKGEPRAIRGFNSIKPETI